jgi:Holliday junction resolvase
MSRASREKGKRGEREVAEVFRDAGFQDAHRTGQMQSNALGTHADVSGVPSLHLEVKRCEVLKVPAWIAQAKADAKSGDEPVVAFRQSGEPWRAVVDLRWLAELVADRELRVHADEL